MSRPPLRLAMGILMACLAISVQGQSPVTDEARLRAVMERYFAALAQKDLAALVRLWSERSPELASRLEQLQQQFSSEGLTLTNLSLAGMRIEGDRAILETSADATITNAKTRRARQEKFVRRFALIKEQNEWRVWRDASNAEDLAAFLRPDGGLSIARDSAIFEEFGHTLIKAESEGARRRLLDDNPQLLTPELRGALLRIGGQSQAAGLYTRAIPAYEALALVAEKMDDRASIAMAEAALGDAYHHLGRHAEALAHLEKALAAYEGLKNNLQIGAVLDQIGAVYLAQGDYARALASYERMRELFVATKNVAGQANALENIGSVHYEQGRYGDCLSFYEAALKLRQALSRRAEIAATLNNIGGVHYREENYTAAIDYFERALAEFEAHGDRQAAAGTMNNLGGAHYQQGNYDTALEFYQKSLRIAEGLGDRDLQATARRGAGLVHYAQGNAAQALEHLQKNLALSEALGQRTRMAETLHVLGLVYEQQQDYGAALASYERSLQFYQETGSRADSPVVMSLIGGVHFAENRFEQARTAYQQALAEFTALGDGEGIANATASLGAAYLAERNTAAALEQYQKALAMFEAAGRLDGVAAILERMANVYFQQNDYAHSLEMAERAAGAARQAENDDALWRARATAGAVYRATNQAAKAEQCLGDAIAVITAMHERLVFGERARQGFYKDKPFPFLALMDLLLAQNRVAEAFAIAERLKANALTDAVQGSGVRIAKTMSPAEIHAERRLENQIISIKAQTAREKQRRQPDARRLADLKAQLENARSDYQAFETKLYATHPQLKSLRGEGAPLKLEEVAGLFTDVNTALLEFIVAPARTYLFTFTHAATPSLAAYAIDARREAVAERVARFREAIERRDQAIGPAARELYDSLLKPARAQIVGKRTLVIVPDGLLWQLPFQALQPADDHYLIEDAAIAYAPSLAALKAVTPQRRPAARAATLLAFANPLISRETAARARLASKDEALTPLAEAENATRAIASLYGLSRSRVYTDAQAREQVAEQEAAAFRVLHFAAPAMFSDTSPTYSHVALAATAEKDDGLIEAWELFRLDLRADLVVLAASTTPHGINASGEGLLAFVHGLRVAGCPSLLASHWRADSKGASQLLVEFHRQLLRNNLKGKAAALRHAALTVIRSDAHRHPFDWAGFSLVGDYW
ncbi:MAG TPA: tetratricopeptide repeat protein [Blastocatellia bacterium]|nr:tetratricopeptide repeat protein [Blastocatellia bacterium]